MDKAAKYRERAAYLRRAAKQSRQPQIRRQLLDLAADYEHLADLKERIDRFQTEKVC